MITVPPQLDPSARPLRLAVVSTPRSGNTWLRRMLATGYGLAELSRHLPEDVPWAELAPRSILQIHWNPEPAFEERLAAAGCTPLVLCRHPFDVLLSILQFAGHEPETARWLGGAGGDESSIIGHTPAGDAFLRYGLSERAARLLDVSRQWLERPGICVVRYEDLVADPVGELDRLAHRLGTPLPSATWQGAVAANSMEALRATSTNRHFWKGSPGLWRQLLPSGHLTELYVRHHAHLAALGYPIELPAPVTPDRAEATWLEAIGQWETAPTGWDGAASPLAAGHR